jgi:hypothetical protein
MQCSCQKHNKLKINALKFKAKLKADSKREKQTKLKQKEGITFGNPLF